MIAAYAPVKRPYVRFDDHRRLELGTTRSGPVPPGLQTPCWIWMGSRKRPRWKGGEGYGTITVLRRSLLAHRFAYELLVGPIPEGLELDHLCDRPPCCNPEHLKPSTPRENTLRSSRAPAARNARKTHCNNGHEFTPENTYDRPNAQGRDCKICIRDRSREHKRRVRTRR